MSDVVVTAQTHKTMRVPGHDFKIAISSEDFAKLSPDQKLGLHELVARAARSADLQRAFDHFDAHNVPTVIIRIGAQSLSPTGQMIPFSSGAIANVRYITSADPVHGKRGDQTNIVDGTSVIININDAKLDGFVTTELLAKILAHELMHPVTPDVPGEGGGIETMEHKAVYAAADRAINAIFQNQLPSASPSLYLEGGVATIGSSSDDLINGTGLNDALAGLNGDDTISGGAGSNAIFGGSGRDVLVSSGVNDYLNGGLDGDLYVFSSLSIDATIEETGGIDRVQLSSPFYEYDYSRVGYDLIIQSNTGSGERLVIVNQFAPSGVGRVEMFKLGGNDFPASQIETWTAQIPPGGGTGPAYAVVFNFNENDTPFVSPEPPGLAFDGDGDLDFRPTELWWMSSKAWQTQGHVITIRGGSIAPYHAAPSCECPASVEVDIRLASIIADPLFGI